MPPINPIVLGIAAACIVFLVAMYVLQRIKSTQNEKVVAQAKADFEDAKEKLKESKRALIESISKIYGNDYAYQVSNGLLWVGMPTQLLLIAKGKASNIKQSADTNSVTQVWLYNTTDQTGKVKHAMEVFIKNNLVIKWEDKN